jgi:radical SAM protein with 4Fe4S-binding SPASM domain
MTQKTGFPASVLVETTLRCPADCIICPNKKIDSRPRDMSWNLFTRVVDQCRGMGVAGFYPFINGEPLASPFLEEALDYVSRTLPGTSIGIYTSGSLLDSEKTSLLLRNNVREIDFSVDGVSKQVYEKHRRGLVYEQVMANIMSFLAICRQQKKKIKTRVVLTLTPDNEKEVAAFYQLWKDLVDVVDVLPCDGRGGEGRLPAFMDSQKLGCFQVANSTYILTDGSVVPCCKDWTGYTVLGNVDRNSLQSIWNSPDYVRFRRDVSGGVLSSFEVCRRCVADSL